MLNACNVAPSFGCGAGGKQMDLENNFGVRIVVSEGLASAKTPRFLYGILRG